jgi:hypothetical protein
MATYLNENVFLRSFKRFNSLFSQKYEWQTGISEKEHMCEFGHPIQPETLYFKKLMDPEGEKKIRVCTECMHKLVFVTVDSDLHAKQVTGQIYMQRKPQTTKIEKMALIR